MSRRLAGWQARRGLKEDNPACPPYDPEALLGPHDELEHVADRPNYSREGGVALHHCGRCDSWWEFWWLSYFNECALRRARVPSVAHWQQSGRPGRAAVLSGLCLVVLLGSLGTAAVMFLAWLAVRMLVAGPVTRVVAAALLLLLALYALRGLLRELRAAARGRP
jgi:hypothetical protein